jgi:hypothetical protein
VQLCSPADWKTVLNSSHSDFVEKPLLGASAGIRVAETAAAIATQVLIRTTIGVIFKMAHGLPRV